jgi:predicted HD phosphohydrolase
MMHSRFTPHREVATMSEAPIATYARMDEGTVEDYAIMASYKPARLAELPDRLMGLLVGLGDKTDGSPIDGYAHSLQSATLAYHDGAEDETVFAALMHDIGQVYSEHNHSEVSAAILKPYLSERAYQVVKHHGIFQGYYYFDKIGRDKDEREQFRGHPAFEMTERFCRDYDQVSFDPDYETRPIDHFMPRMQAIFGREPWGPHTRELWPAS